MASKVTARLVPIVIIAVSVGLAVGLSTLRKPPERVVEQRPALLVQAELLMPEDITYRIASQGMVMPRLETSLVSEVNGRITRVSEHFVAGGFFQKGDVLVQVEPADYLTNVKAAQAALASAQAMLEEEKARVRVAESEWRSFTQGQAPALGLRQPQLASALANVQSKEAELERAQRDLARTDIRAPFAGMVRQRNANLGQFVSRGSILGQIYGTDVAEVRLPLSDNDLAFVPLDMLQQSQLEQTLHVTLKAEVAGIQVSWPARIVRTEGVLDERSRVIYAVAEVQDPYRLIDSSIPVLQFGRFVQAEITGINTQQVVKVPRHLLRPGNQLLVVDSERSLQFRAVEVERADAQFAYIRSGFAAGDRVALSPVSNPLAGTIVRLQGEPAVDTEQEKAASLTSLDEEQ